MCETLKIFLKKTQSKNSVANVLWFKLHEKWIKKHTWLVFSLSNNSIIFVLFFSYGLRNFKLYFVNHKALDVRFLDWVCFTRRDPDITQVFAMLKYNDSRVVSTLLQQLAKYNSTTHCLVQFEYLLQVFLKAYLERSKREYISFECSLLQGVS